MASNVSTRFLVLSDTHGKQPKLISDRADVAIHCGDLTEESKLDEFRAAVQFLKQINAPLKLVIAGNHDFTLDIPMFRKKLQELRPSDEDNDLVKIEYGEFGEARKLFQSEDARDAGIVFLDEGIHELELANGTHLTAYASPYTPSVNDWGFQYDPQHEHNWKIDNSVDVVITHGPPYGVLDIAGSRQRAGSPCLFRAIARSRPRMHCFGHIHNAWGAKKIAWRNEIGGAVPSHFTAINNHQSMVVENLASLRPYKFDTPDMVSEKELKQAKYCEQGFCAVRLPLRAGEETLFINAALQGTEGLQQLPWMVDIELPRSERLSAKALSGS